MKVTLKDVDILTVHWSTGFLFCTLEK